MKEYLGDAVYVDRTEYGDVVLTTEDGTSLPTNRIVLEPQVVKAFIAYLRAEEHS